MKIYVETSKNDRLLCVDTLNAYMGFAHMIAHGEMDAEVEFWPSCYTDKLQSIGLPPVTREDIVITDLVGYNAIFRELGIKMPAPLDYPQALQRYLGRKIERSILSAVLMDKHAKPYFVKPASSRGKEFTGMLIRDFEDIGALLHLNEDMPVWISEPVDFVSEWRVFVHGSIVGAKPYKGDWRAPIDWTKVDRMVYAFASEAPAAYSLDVGVTSRGETLLVECNDGYALGSYDLESSIYARMITARLRQITGACTDGIDLMDAFIYSIRNLAGPWTKERFAHFVAEAHDRGKGIRCPRCRNFVLFQTGLGLCCVNSEECGSGPWTAGDMTNRIAAAMMGIPTVFGTAASEPSAPAPHSAPISTRHTDAEGSHSDA